MTCIQILYTEGWKDMAEIVLPIAAKYCNKHGYKLFDVCYAGEYYSDFGYNKLIKVKKRFEEGFDCVWCIDLDAIITNETIKIEDLLEEDKDFYISFDFNGLNAGSFLIKKSDWSIAFIDTLLYLHKEYPNLYCEQDAIRHFMGLRVNIEPIKILLQNQINSYDYSLYPEIPPQTYEQGQWEQGDLLFHCPGIGYEKRLQVLTNIKEQIIYE